MEWFIAVVVIAILGVAAMAAAGGMGQMAEDPVRDTFRQDLPSDRMLDATDVQALRFGVTLRGYSMDQVDDLLDRLAREIAERDATIAELAGHPLGEVTPGRATPSQVITEQGLVEQGVVAADPQMHTPSSGATASGERA